MEKLKIPIFNYCCWLRSEAGGAEVFTREGARSWVDRGHEVTLFVFYFPNYAGVTLLMSLRMLEPMRINPFIQGL